MTTTARDIINKLIQQQAIQQQWAAQHFEIMEDGHFSAIAINGKQCVLAPYPEFSALIYRGQNQYYEPCKSSLYRTSLSKIERFIAEMRIAEFHILLSSHPAVIDFASWSVMGLRIKIDFEGLAQHFGLATQLIDFTSNPLIAAFFACCEYDRKSKSYKPILQSTQKGVFYTYFEAADVGDPTGPKIPHSSIVGLQPLRRPAEQYAWCYRLPKRASLNSRPFLTCTPFLHDRRVSIKVFERFEGGEQLFPSDPLAEKALHISLTKKFSQNAFQMAMAKHGKKMKQGSTLNALKRKGIAIINTPTVAFSETEQQEISKDWDARKPYLFSRIHFRKACPVYASADDSL
ncbi:FRG domain-containing protein [Desulfatibacillum alkenivorans DSM 16219]|uniref:FRG domain-containing protein n=1 Tax=Desulfatibacillum alkenivorans DSM 16219 TaxID=1121393 RepID=A0A1M6X376_9BACT|nr:FRG domain-containing protein [Desulfatibacillum alkenivorans]SHL00374.1 FRG domain-containing protein [Desulfatibacillum alkenivorans DSM 16219]